MSSQYTVSDYLKDRLGQLGLDRMFGVAGNYTAAFLNTILADESCKIAISGNANEICSGFAADGYARFKGIGAVFLTYSVGAFTALNTVAGSYVEQVPIVFINGAPTTKEQSIENNAGVLFSHTTGYKFVDIDMFRSITAAAERVTNGTQAPFQIDSVLTALWTEKRPVYLEFVENVWRAPCSKPEGQISSGTKAIVTVSEVPNAVDGTIALLKKRPKFIFWAGAEIIRFGLQKQLVQLLDAANKRVSDSDEFVGYVTSKTSKSVLSEDSKYYQGTFSFSDEEINELVGTDGTFIALGSWITGKNTVDQSIRGDGRVILTSNYATVGSDFYASVDLGEYMEELTTAITSLSDEQAVKLRKLKIKSVPSVENAICEGGDDDSTMTYDKFFDDIQAWITKDDILVVDAGFPLIGAESVRIPSQGGFVAQASWLSIGYSVPAATGIKCACPDKRVIVVVGDGAFHETCQALSDHAAYGQNTAVFVIVNGLYGIEQFIVNPNPFRSDPTNYSQELLNEPYPYNQLPKWNFAKLAEGWGGIGLTASNSDDLQSCLDQIRKDDTSNFLVAVTVPELDIPATEKATADGVGEDETLNKNWPPANIF